jgi:predicted nucleic acid-binding protein
VNIFIDTSAFLAILNIEDQFHPPAKQSWDEILSSSTALYSSNYIILETTTLLQHRFGIDAIRLFESEIQPVIELVWVDELMHRQALSALLAANRRNLSLVDCTSFEIVRRIGLDSVFTFDKHFSEQGFTIMPDIGEP